MPMAASGAVSASLAGFGARRYAVLSPQPARLHPLHLPRWPKKADTLARMPAIRRNRLP